jgi:hypothetical protein
MAAAPVPRRRVEELRNGIQWLHAHGPRRGEHKLGGPAAIASPEPKKAGSPAPDVLIIVRRSGDKERHLDRPATGDQEEITRQGAVRGNHDQTGKAGPRSAPHSTLGAISSSGELLSAHQLLKDEPMGSRLPRRERVR